MAQSLKQQLKQDNPQLTRGVSKFLERFERLSASRSQPMLATAFHQFGWEWSSTTRRHTGQLRFGKRIAVQVTATGRNKGRSRGKKIMIPGRPTNKVSNTITSKSTQDSVHNMPIRNAPKGRRIHSLHSLQLNISQELQNAGKW